MNIFYLLFLILLTARCGIDKEAVTVPVSSVNNQGELDISFNSNGILSLHNSAGGNDNDEIYGLAIDSQDRVIAVGRSNNNSGNGDMTVWRLNANGFPDSSFSGDGVFTHHNAAGGADTDIGYSVVVGPSDEIYITGTSLNGAGNFDMVVWKVTTSGVLDTSFNGTGFFTHDNAAGGALNDQGTDIAIDQAGKLVITGFSDQTLTNRDMALWKLNSNGTLDTSFDTDGFTSFDSLIGGEDDNGNAVVIDSANNLWVAGRSDSAINSGDMIVWKYTSAGALDTTFNGTGFFSHNGAAGGTDFDSATDLVFDSAGDLYITGYSRNASGDNDMVLWKLQSSGSLDTTFDSDGIVSFDVSSLVSGTTNDTGESLLIDSQGRIVVAGSGNEDLCVWRYNTDGSIDNDFNTDGFFSHDSAAGGFSIDSGTSLQEDSLNRIYIGGFSENNSSDFDAVFWRLK